ncbi:hypothetical protein C8R47DRAFT_1064142 [Mycena vitilis]|nr:hypothetical protein C8R47DRAFT_1064142 [Mycena vitilis]
MYKTVEYGEEHAAGVVSDSLEAAKLLKLPQANRCRNLRPNFTSFTSVGSQQKNLTSGLHYPVIEYCLLHLIEPKLKAGLDNFARKKLLVEPHTRSEWAVHGRENAEARQRGSPTSRPHHWRSGVRNSLPPCAANLSARVGNDIAVACMRTDVEREIARGRRRKEGTSCLRREALSRRGRSAPTIAVSSRTLLLRLCTLLSPFDPRRTMFSPSIHPVSSLQGPCTDTDLDRCREKFRVGKERGEGRGAKSRTGDPQAACRTEKV